MDRLLYVAMSGAKESFHGQAAVNNNLANANTPGFLADLQHFRSMPVFGAGYPTRVYALSERPDTDFAPGAIQSTGRDLDIAVQGDGWIAVQAPDGREAYTRRGDLQIDPNGRLLTGDNLPVMGNSGPIALPPAEKAEIGSDGTISVRPPGVEPNELVVVDRIKLVKPPPGSLQKDNDGLLRLKDGSTAEADPTLGLLSGALTSSNVNGVNEMVDMIELSRRFELQVRMMKVAEESSAASASLLRAV
jgi:flagellar basal-body rod protein FlgF